MKGFVLACALGGLLSLPAAAQRGGSHGGFAHPSPPASTGPVFGIPPVGPIPPLGMTTPGQERSGGRRGFGGGYGYYPGFYTDYDGGAYPPPASPGVVYVMPPPAPTPPPEPAQPVLHDYTKENGPEAAGAPTEFAIVGKDHVTRRAVAVWTQGGALHYIDPDGAGGQLPLGAVDREATRQANAAVGLKLQVPAS
jgi:hypothetical protein